MKSTFLLSILAVASIGLIDAQQAQAQERRGARFDFAPNYFRTEQPRIPKFADGPSAVKQGAMPRSSSFLGVDPGMLQSRPQPLPQVAAHPAVPSVSSRAFVPNTAFHPGFGQPIQPLQAGQPIAMAPATAPMPQMAAPTAAKAAAPVHRPRGSAHHPTRQIRTAVAGKMRTPTHPSGQSAVPATYGNNFGYVPGEHLPAVQIGSGTHSRADVHGRIIKH